MQVKRKCYNCSKLIKKRQKYCLHMEIFAAPEVELDKQDLSKDYKVQMKRICEQVKDMDSKKLEEDVYICYDLVLCKTCRDAFVQRIKCREII